MTVVEPPSEGYSSFPPEGRTTWVEGSVRIARAVAERPARSLAVEGVGATSKAGLVARFIGRRTRIDVTARRDRRLPASTGERDVTSRSTSLSAPIVNPFRDVADQIVDPEGARAARVRARWCPLIEAFDLERDIIRSRECLVVRCTSRPVDRATRRLALETVGIRPRPRPFAGERPLVGFAEALAFDAARVRSVAISRHECRSRTDEVRVLEAIDADVEASHLPFADKLLLVTAAPLRSATHGARRRILANPFCAEVGHRGAIRAVDEEHPLRARRIAPRVDARMLRQRRELHR